MSISHRSFPKTGKALIFTVLMGMAMFTVDAQPCYCDDPNATTVGSPGITTDLTVAIAQGDLLPAQQAAATPQNLCIQGTLNINLSDYDFTTSLIHMGNDASIIIPFFSTLNLTNSSLYGCTDMWNNITVFAGGKLTATSTTFRDAQTAIVANNFATLGLESNSFINNHTGIDASNFFTGSVFMSSPMNGNTFTTNGALISGGIGNVGIRLNNMNGFTVGTTNGSASANVFDNLENGIIANRSSFGVHGATFLNMPDVGGLTPSIPIGYGIFAENRSFANVTNCSFETLSTAIHGTDSSLDVFENVFNSNSLQGTFINTGIRAVGSNNFTRINVHDNTISSLLFGVQFIEIGNANNFDVVDNTINIGDPANNPAAFGISGIRVDNSDFSPSSVGLINNNTINLFAARDGILITESSWINILNNDITVTPPPISFTFQGMAVSSCKDLSVRDNSVLGTNSNIPFRGLYVISTTSSGICCNTFNGVPRSVQFSGTCTGTSFRGNIMGTSQIGLWYEADASTGPQDRAGNLWSGGYTNVGARHSGNLQSMLASRYTVNTSIPLAWPPSIDPQFSWFTSTFLQGTFACQGLSTCKKHITIPQDTLSVEHRIASGDWDSGLGYQSALDWEGERYLFDKLDKNQDLMQGEALFQAFYNSMAGTTVELFTDIRDDIAALADVSPSEMAQYQSNQALLATYLHGLAAIDSQLYDATEPLLSTLQGQRDALLDNMASMEAASDALLTIIHNARLPLIQQIKTTNNTIFTTEVFEQNEKEVNDVWLNTIAQGIYSFTPAQKTTLEGIIYQCPQYGSNAVRRARGLYSLITMQEYDDEQLCTPPQELQGNGNMATNTVAAEFKLYPNPASDKINLVLGEMGDVDVGVQITDVSGKVVREVPLPTGQRLHSIGLDGLAKGTYFCKVLNNKKQVFVKTFAIAR